MFDFSWSEIALLVVVALIFIGPKDLPVAIRTLSRGLKAMRKMASEFQTHVDDMVRDADLSEARDQFRDLKRFDFRERMTKAIDGDNSIRRSLEIDAPVGATAGTAIASGVSDLPRVPAPPPPPPPYTFGMDAQPYNARMQEAERELAGAPSILPPATARRLLNERPRWRAPDILPPVRAIHRGARVAISTEGEGT
ncbi:Sec-independent protein translocase protein TatB [Gluconobacter wancherniae]|mgnify:FL=1|uniref:Sec-independent protein translocase protein TatB n=1 Tax=Gluconobacter wancherniae TaxID=1307955 RepID=UPI001B8BFC37|nr:Sec-independent protein translocase protein TatB [Gluconobacter wancherniae]MBS1087704.1 twin-arginine translocase subunit TatB [Gluconobacter wancherniae]